MEALKLADGLSKYVLNIVVFGIVPSVGSSNINGDPLQFWPLKIDFFCKMIIGPGNNFNFVLVSST